MTFVLVSLFLGIIVGIVSALFGIGGGIFIVPLLPNLMGFTPHQAVATSLASVFMVTCLNTVAFAREKLVNWQAGILLGVPSGLMAFFAGSWAASTGELFLRVFFLLILMALLVVTFLRRKFRASEEDLQSISLVKKICAVLISSVAGFISSFTGIGAGIILSPVMFNLKMVRARELVPTTNLSTMLTTFSGALGYFLVEDGVEAPLIDKSMALSLFVVATLTAIWIRPYQSRLSQSKKILFLCGILLFMIGKQAYELSTMHF